ncbi:MAG: hypothetical protein EA367_17515 [Leptolyngbya sp. DLM2.Bin15]|nr:MAG: hypothetical protein EA367_17515 [Leptolyngbya sp. DLM2.Bin15]
MPTSILDLKQLQQALQSHLERQDAYSQTCDLRLLAHGEANVTFRLNAAQLVRVAVNTPNQRFGGVFSRITQFEQAILTYLSGSGISHELCQAQLAPSDDFPWTYLITNYLEGRSLNYSPEDLKKAAQTLAQLHRLPLSPNHDLSTLMPKVPVVDQPLSLFYQESQAYAQPYVESPQADPQIVDLLNQVLDLAQQRLWTEQWLTDWPHRCLVHSDHTYENWVVGGDRAYLIDWEWAEIGSPAGDLGHFLSPVTVQRRPGYHMPESDRTLFLQEYYAALDDDRLAATIQRHFTAFGPFPAVRSLCWTAGYWITANRWYADAGSASATERLERLEQSRLHFPSLCAAVIAWLEDKPVQPG